MSWIEDNSLDCYDPLDCAYASGEGVIRDYAEFKK